MTYTDERNSWINKRTDAGQPPIDRATETDQVIQFVRNMQLPEDTQVERVGDWVWISFDGKPADDVRKPLGFAGFRWIKKRGKWAHPCGNFSRGSVIDPRDKYKTERITA